MSCNLSAALNAIMKLGTDEDDVLEKSLSSFN